MATGRSPAQHLRWLGRSPSLHVPLGTSVPFLSVTRIQLFFAVLAAATLTSQGVGVAVLVALVVLLRVLIRRHLDQAPSSSHGQVGTAPLNAGVGTTLPAGPMVDRGR